MLKIQRSVLGSLVAGIFFSTAYAGHPIFTIQLKPGEENFPSNLGLHEPPVQRLFSITNQSATDMTGMIYKPPAFFAVDSPSSTCSSVLAKGKSCILAVKFNPGTLGSFGGQLKVCGGNGHWCSLMATPLSISVTTNHVVLTDIETIQLRPFSTLDYTSSQQYADNFNALLTQVLHVAPTHSEFSYIQHIPSVNETTTPCLEATQKNVGLNPDIKGGGVPLCTLMGYATSNAGAQATSKLFPPYLDFLLATPFPIIGSTVPVNSTDLALLLNQFSTVTTDSLVRDVGYTGHVDFLTAYYQQQLNKTYQNCGTSEVCPSIFYLPYNLTSDQAALEVWPAADALKYWGISGGGGSGAGYQIQAFKPGTAVHYTLFSGGGGGGAGNTTPEGSGNAINLINVGSGGGGGSQFADCYRKNNVNLNGLGLGAGTGSGLSTLQGTHVTFQQPPAVQYSFYAPASNPSWTHQVILENYTQNLDYLFNTLIPQLYEAGYTITVTGGGGGGTGLEFLNAAGAEFMPHPVSIGYGFTFCYAFNKAHQFKANDCIPSENAGPKSETINNIVYQNLGNFFNQGMALAILPENCNGYSNFVCNCKFQNAYVICQLDNVLTANGFTSADIPTWLINPHCDGNLIGLMEGARLIDRAGQKPARANTVVCQSAVQRFAQVKSAAVCVPPW